MARHLVKQSSRQTRRVEWPYMRKTAQPRHSVRGLEHLAQARSYLDGQACDKKDFRI